MEKIIKKKTSKQKKKLFFKFSKNIFLSCLIIGTIIFGKFYIKNIVSDLNFFNKKIDVIESVSQEDYSKNNAYKYSNFEIQGTSWLSFRDIPELIHEYVHGRKVLDFGCGAGRSTKFLRNLELNVTGTDISSEFLKQAHRVDKIGKYMLMKKGKIPAKNNFYDLVFSSHVLLMIPEKEQLNKAFNEMYRVTKRGGTCIAVTGSEKMHAFDGKWVSYKTNFSENLNPKRGDVLKLMIKDCGAVFHDYNWTNEDYLESIESSGFELLKIHYPLGKANERYEWLSEKKYSPYVIYVLRKPELKIALK